MTWFKVDDNLAFHPKVLAAGNAAMGLWVRAGSWSAQQLTDGVIPDSILPSLGTRRQANALVTAGLWTRGERSFAFHQWNDDGRQPTREKIESERQAATERQRKHREARASSQRDEDVTNSVSHGAVTPSVTPTPTRPDPTRPVNTLSNESVGAAKRGTRVPDPFPVDASMRAWAGENAPAAALDRETSQFVDHWAAKPGKDALKLDWRRAWQTWMRNAQKFAERDGWKPVENVTHLRDVTAEREAAQKAKWLKDHGITEAEYEANKHDVAWLRRITGGDSA